MIQADIEEKLITYIRDELRIEIRDVDSNLMKSGMIDSFNMIQLILIIEERFNVSIDMEELDIDNFNSVESMARKIREWQAT